MSEKKLTNNVMARTLKAIDAEAIKTHGQEVFAPGATTVHAALDRGWARRLKGGLLTLTRKGAKALDEWESP